MPPYTEGSRIRYKPTSLRTSHIEPVTATVIFVLTTPAILQGRHVPASKERPRYWVQNERSRKCVVLSDKEILGLVVENVVDLKRTKERRGAIVEFPKDGRNKGA